MDLVSLLLGLCFLAILLFPLLAFLVWRLGAPGGDIWLARFRRVTRPLRCPVTGRPVTVDFLVPKGGGQPFDILGCTAFDRPRPVTCGKQCLRIAAAA